MTMFVTSTFSELPLFSLREEYLMTHNKQGVRYDIARLPETERKKRCVNYLQLTEGMTFTDGIGVPNVEAYNGTVDFDIVSYNDRRKATSSNNPAIHFFMDDYKYKPILNNVEKTTRILVEMDCIVFAVDFSLYVNVPQHVNIHNIYLNRLFAAYWQRCGITVIPTASWGNVDSFKYCFEGLPQHSVIAVCGIGHAHCRSADTLWRLAIREMEKRLSPSKIIVYGGKKPDAALFDTEIVYFEDHITKYFR